MKRVGIYFFYDTDGVVDDYVGYFLEAINQHLEKLIIVVNGKLTVQGRQYLEAYSDDVIVRENIGFDVWAYKTAIEYIGWDELAEYDELLLMNYTQFGPIYPFSEMFDAMNVRELDFWGVTTHHESVGWYDCPMYGYLPEHIQSSFIVIRNKLLASIEYKKFWQNMPVISTYDDSVKYYEGIFTKYFNDMGFSSGTYINTEHLRDITRYPLLLAAREVVIKQRCPVIKRKMFYGHYGVIVQESLGTDARQTYEYIKSYTSYDTGLIWQNILRTCNMRDIWRMLQLNYVASNDTLCAKNVVNKQITSSVGTIGLVAHLYFEDEIEYCIKYIKNAVECTIDVFITTHTQDMKAKIQKVLLKSNISAEIQVVENRGRDVSALLVGAKDFVLSHDLICFVHDKKTTQVKPWSIGQAFAETCFENTLSSTLYVSNVIDLFKNNDRLGILSPLLPLIGPYIQATIDGWTDNFEITQNFLKKNNFKVPIDRRLSPVSPYGTMFWFRTEALRNLFELNFSYDYFPKEPIHYDGTILHAIERSYSLIAQSEGFYAANISTHDFVRTQLTTYEYIYGYLAHQSTSYPTYYQDLNYKVYAKIVSVLPRFVKKPLKYMIITLIDLKNRLKKQ